MTPRDKIKEKFALLFCNALRAEQELQAITLLDLTANKDVANNFYVLAEAILNALPVEWVDSESEVQVGDEVTGFNNKEFLNTFRVPHGYDIQGDIKEFEVKYKITQRNSKPAINVDEVL